MIDKPSNSQPPSIPRTITRKPISLADVVPNRDFLAIEYPGFIVTIDEALRTLGGLPHIESVSESGQSLRLKLRPDDPTSHPLYGERHMTVRILLRIQRPKKKPVNRQSDANSSVSPHSSFGHPSPPLVEVISRVPYTYRFSTLADFQFLPVDPLLFTRPNLDRFLPEKSRGKKSEPSFPAIRPSQRLVTTQRRLRGVYLEGIARSEGEMERGRYPDKGAGAIRDDDNDGVMRVGNDPSPIDGSNGGRKRIHSFRLEGLSDGGSNLKSMLMSRIDPAKFELSLARHNGLLNLTPMVFSKIEVPLDYLFKNSCMKRFVAPEGLGGQMREES
eukprot:CAMPEP_0175047934 /NCGR_PEP_ID=MMETSP0052_2-20121109/5886_1 /TAXON_ID=51329 ORGANISM="Polytomella parva, Strain SAG 63-3" /NCGR_SAMPLE_ID=MMETSP0052_2 /ASSEMBLY_ACC=CAM_ASM_000194 /LENGTH=329 /DNA_ID=CAMNT_0016311895 /DNA_START=290 /DNA_END=1276 /DNA_ORIENTATION=-